MANVYFCPGFGGSALNFPNPQPVNVWLSYSAMTSGAVRLMRLGANGIQAGEPYGAELVAADPLRDYFGQMADQLSAQLLSQGDTLQLVGFDWRKSADLTAQDLARRIATDVAAGLPCTLIGYSFGALVARRAWWYLSMRGQANLVRRVVLIGGPNYGCYQGVLFWGQESSSLFQLALLSNINPGSSLAGAFVGRPLVLTDVEIVAISMTWPAMYEAMPALGAPDAAADPNRALLFRSNAWPVVQPSQLWLDYAVNSWQPWLLSAASVPPPAVLTCVAGTGTPTAYQWRGGGSLNNAGTYNVTNDGDGVVTVAQNFLPGAATVLLNSSHADVYDHLVDSGQLLKLINDPRVPPQPAPPPQHVPAVVPLYRQDAPLPPTVFSGQLPAAIGRWQPGGDP